MCPSCYLWLLQIKIGRMVKRHQEKDAICSTQYFERPANHLNDCYLCMADKKKLAYLNIPSSIAPVPHDEHIPAPPTIDQVNMEILDKYDDYMKEQEDETWQSDEPHFPNQHELDGLDTDLNLPKAGAELLASRLKEWNLLQSTVRTTKYRMRHTFYAQYFTADKSFCFCSGVITPEQKQRDVSSNWYLTST